MAKNEREEYLEIDLLKILTALWRRAWAIVLAALIFGGAAFAYAYKFTVPMYQSSALLYINNSSDLSVGSTKVNLADLTASQGLVDTYIVILRTRSMLNAVISRADLSYSYEELRNMISASSVNETEILQVTVTGPNPEETAMIVNTIADVLPDRVSVIIDGSSVNVVDYAVGNGTKVGNEITRYTTIGLLLGAVLAAAVIVIIELLDEQIRDDEYLTQTYGLPLLSVIPDLQDRGKGKGKGYYKKGYYASGSYRSYSEAAVKGGSEHGATRDSE